ncbi:family 1 glycosyltransferase [Xylariaceae sp. FL1019]|nr:family 1 glycosyltransferase [Xylariaceae sp. FL1019]
MLLIVQRGILVTSALVVAVAVSVLFSQAPAPQNKRGPDSYIAGRNNTVLILGGGASGLSNIHIAASYGLLEHTPHVSLHYASFAVREKDVARISSMAVRDFPTVDPITWHELPGPDYLDCVYRHIGNISGMIFAPGLKGAERQAAGMGFHLDPWEPEEYVRLYRHVRDLIVQVDPAVVVLDMSLRPALDATVDLNRRFAMLSPNAVADIIGASQAWGKSLWKYPAQGSGLAYPLPWSSIPLNVYLHVRFAVAYLMNNGEKSKRAYYESQGIKNHAHFLTIRDVPWITMTTSEAGIPLAVPDEVTECGPIVLDDVVEAVAGDGKGQQELRHWLERAPTILVNLGSLFKYDEPRARIMARVIELVLTESKSTARDVQIIWKFARLGEYGDEFLRPLQRFKDNGRFLFSQWLDIEPPALLRSGHIVLSVHHGGANSYHEAIYAGVPQVIFPLWYDLYNYARLVEYLGVGVWPGKDIAPAWDAETLGRGVLSALDKPELSRSSKRIADASRKYGGRAAAAAVISDMAAQGRA